MIDRHTQFAAGMAALHSRLKELDPAGLEAECAFLAEEHRSFRGACRALAIAALGMVAIWCGVIFGVREFLLALPRLTGLE